MQPSKLLSRCLQAHAVLNKSDAAMIAQPRDRVLRYPDGVVRTIRYPTPPNPGRSALTVSRSSHDEEEDDDDFVICGERDSGCLIVSSYETERMLPGAAPGGILWGDEQIESPQAAAQQAARRAEQDAIGARTSTSLPSSPAELLKLLQSDAYKADRAALGERVAASFKLLTGSPWLAPMPLFLLSVRRPNAESASTYTLPTTTRQVCAKSALAITLC